MDDRFSRQLVKVATAKDVSICMPVGANPATDPGSASS